MNRRAFGVLFYETGTCVCGTLEEAMSRRRVTPHGLVLLLVAAIWSASAFAGAAPAGVPKGPADDPPVTLRLGFFTRSLATLAAQTNGDRKSTRLNSSHG